MKRPEMIVLSALISLIALTAGCAASKTVDAIKPNITISFSYAEELRYLPSYAVWVADESGTRATLYATGKAAANRWGGPERPSALPIWSGIRETNVDTVSSATPISKAFIQCNLPQQFGRKKLKLYIEANSSFDYNDYYKQGLQSGQEGYNDVNGQPSMLWMAELDPAQVRGETAPILVGAGEVMGADHGIHDNLSHVTTAKELLRAITVKYDFIK